MEKYPDKGHVWCGICLPCCLRIGKDFVVGGGVSKWIDVCYNKRLLEMLDTSPLNGFFLSGLSDERGLRSSIWEVFPIFSFSFFRIITGEEK